MADEEIYEKYRLAGKACAEAGIYGRKLVKPDFPLLELGNEIENYILDKGVSLSFPVNISLDSCAAHYSPAVNDDSILPAEGLLKIDIGTHVDGYIADHAISIDIGNSGGVYTKLIDSATKALDVAVKNFLPGTNVIEIGRRINESIQKDGFRPIRNLGGHNLQQNLLHGGIFVPNVPSGTPYILKEGDVFAIEPFSTNGAGYVVDGPKTLIYRFLKRPKKQINMRLRSALEHIRRNFNGLPFSPRWLEKNMSSDSIMLIIKELERKNLIHGYPLLMEADAGLVSQMEHTVIVHEDHAEITTKI
ncbi:MAG: type II methionyl aminopeptidase [Candidatus Hodarchaeota archaeon]